MICYRRRKKIGRIVNVWQIRNLFCLLFADGRNFQSKPKSHGSLFCKHSKPWKLFVILYSLHMSLMIMKVVNQIDTCCPYVRHETKYILTACLNHIWLNWSTANTNMNKTGVINDPLGQPSRWILKFCAGRTDGRTDNMCENSDHYRPGLWSASWINWQYFSHFFYKY